MRFGHTGSREQRVQDMVNEAEALRERPSGRPKSLRLMKEASAIVMELVSEYPQDSRHLQQLGSMQYSLAAIERQTGGYQESLAACDLAEQAYRTLGERFPGTDVDGLLADVRVRRATAHAAAGNAASALPEATAGVSFWLKLTGGADTSPHRLDLARVLSVNAVVLAYWGDPDLAVASADQAIRIYIAECHTATQFALPALHHDYLRWACAVAGSRHAQHGRIDVALSAAELRLHALSSDPFSEMGISSILKINETRARLAALPEELQQEFGQLVAERLRQATPTPSPATYPLDYPFPDLELIVEIATALGNLTEVALGHRLILNPPPPPASLQRLTLRAALERCADSEIASDHDVDHLISSLTAPALDCTILSPAHRIDPRRIPMVAYQLAMLVPPARELDPILALRLALETHALFAVANEHQHISMRLPPGQSIKSAWGMTLLTGSQIANGLNLTPLALDLAAWAGGVAVSLAPFAIADTELAAQIREIAHWHADMLDRVGRPADAAQNRKAATDFPGSP